MAIAAGVVLAAGALSPAGKGLLAFCKVKEWVRGLGSIGTASYPLTPTLSPDGEREHTEFAARTPMAPHDAPF
jgi:hypothetical protein